MQNLRENHPCPGAQFLLAASNKRKELLHKSRFSSRCNNIELIKYPALHLLRSLVGKGYSQDMSVLRLPDKESLNIFTCEPMGLSGARRGTKEFYHKQQRSL